MRIRIRIRNPEYLVSMMCMSMVKNICNWLNTGWIGSRIGIKLGESDPDQDPHQNDQKLFLDIMTVFQLELRKRVERLVREYLCMVTQDRKFVSGTTGDIILNSAS
jgi:hypothetical protein